MEDMGLQLDVVEGSEKGPAVDLADDVKVVDDE